MFFLCHILGAIKLLKCFLDRSEIYKNNQKFLFRYTYLNYCLRFLVRLSYYLPFIINWKNGLFRLREVGSFPRGFLGLEQPRKFVKSNLLFILLGLIQQDVAFFRAYFYVTLLSKSFFLLFYRSVSQSTLVASFWKKTASNFNWAVKLDKTCA